ncbi:MAG TPA: hypothetical protein DD435_15620 [Cyanobacteria bacterium UBA8530]|nr:hypothetical protein [Cyanobacteria bacterium UBA8530]
MLLSKIRRKLKTIWGRLSWKMFRAWGPKKHSDLPRISYLIPGTGISGGLAVICQHASHLQARGFSVSFIDVEESGKPIDWFPGLQVEVIPLSRVKEKLDLAIATGWQTVDPLLWLKADRKCYFVQSDETRFFDDPRIKKKIRKTYSYDFEHFTEARWIQAWLKSEFEKEAHYVPNGLDEKIFFPSEPLEPKRVFRVLLEGAICLPFKGMKEAFEAVAELDCEVWCVSGSGKPEPDWRCDRFFERVPMETMRRIYSSCDVILKMSKVEGFFGPPLEMMACGGTAVVAKVSGYDEYIVDGVNALVVEAGDVEGAKEAVLRLMNDPALRERLSLSGRETAANWRWDRAIDALEEVFRGKKEK